MKRRSLAALVAGLFLLTIPLAALAMDHGKMEGMDGGMMDGMVMLGNQTVDGVKAMAHLKDIHEAMAKMGMDKTNHLMVMFMDTKTGQPISEGSAAVKIKDPSGEVSEPIMLMGMPGGFGADITLPQKGAYTFEIGSKLADGQLRKYDFNYTLK